jgi:predicted DsbA family dithiol-disulfide isomerase
MCPWCLIGKRRLEKALALRPDTPVDIRWRPYQLDPTIPRGGMDRQEYLANKFGGVEQARERYANVVAAGQDEGIPFAFDEIKRSPNTIDAHRLIRWAATAGCQEEVVERLFTMYFVEGRDVGDLQVLNEAAADVGMDTAIVSELLAGDADRELVEKEVATAREIGVRGVPCFIVANRYVVMGAEQPDVIAGAIDMAVKDIENGVEQPG